MALTQWNVVVRLYRDVLVHLYLVDLLQDGQAMTDAGDAHLFQLVVLQGDQRLADNAVFWCGCQFPSTWF